MIIPVRAIPKRVDFELVRNQKPKTSLRIYTLCVIHIIGRYLTWYEWWHGHCETPCFLSPHTFFYQLNRYTYPYITSISVIVIIVLLLCWTCQPRADANYDLLLFEWPRFTTRITFTQFFMRDSLFFRHSFLFASPGTVCNVFFAFAMQIWRIRDWLMAGKSSWSPLLWP